MTGAPLSVRTKQYLKVVDELARMLTCANLPSRPLFSALFGSYAVTLVTTRSIGLAPSPSRPTSA